MARKTILLLYILSIKLSTSFSQEKIGYFKNDLKTNLSYIKDVIPISNSKNNDLSIFIADAKNVYGYKLNDKFEVTSKITSEEKRRKYKTLLGYSISDNESYKIILTNKNEKKFLIVDFSFSEKTTTTKEFVLDDSSEKIIQTLSINNEFYLVTAIPYNNYMRIDHTRKDDSEIDFSDDSINFYSIDKDNNLSKKEVNLSKFKFINKNGYRMKIKSLLLPKYEINKIPKVDTSLSNPIDITANTSKMYIKENKIIFSFDKNNEFTQILEINLDDFSIKKDTYAKKLKKAKRSNSFILDDKIFIASGNKKELLLEIIDTKSKKVLKEFNLYQDKEITIKNSPIIQRGGAYSNYRELKTTKQFLRKITADKFGISLLKTKDQYELSIGGYTPQARGGGMMMGGFGGIPIGGIGSGVSMFFNPTMFAYNAFSGTKSTQIDCLFDLNFEHIKGELPENSFDKIDDFLDGDENWYKDDYGDITEVFKFDNYLILGSFDKTSNSYYFYKFE